MIFRIVAILLVICLANQKQLYMATVFRHGARYPTNNYYDGKQTAPFHGQQTAVGLRQQYLLGNYIAQDYITKANLFNKTLNPRQVQFFTVTDSQRCIESAYGHALGLFPFSSGQIINPNIDKSLLEPPFDTFIQQNLQVQGQIQKKDNQQFALYQGFQPMPIRYGDIFFPKCDNEAHIFVKRAERILPKIVEFQAQHQEFAQKMKNLFNLTQKQANLGVLTQIYDTLISDAYLGRPLPPKLQDKDFQKLSFIQRYLFTIVYEQQPARIFNAPLVHQMISNMQNVIKGNLGVKKISIYSAHDSNVVPLLVYFNLTTAQCLKRQFRNQTIKQNCAIPVPFASNIFFQLYQDDKNATNHYVKVRYNGVYYDLCNKKSQQCNFKQFAEYSLKNLLNFEKECAKPKSQMQKQFTQELSRFQKVDHKLKKIVKLLTSKISNFIHSNSIIQTQQ